MSLRISNIRLRIDEPEAALRPRLARLLGLSEQDAPPYRILRKALDARDYHALSFVYTAEVQVPDEENALARLGKAFGSRHERIDRYFCLGDVVGYGASPNECADLVRRTAEVTILGNHDAAVAGRMDYSYYYEAARHALDRFATPQASHGAGALSDA